MIAQRSIGIPDVNHILTTPLVDQASAQWGSLTGLTVNAGATATTAVTFTKPFGVAPKVVATLTSITDTIRIVVMAGSVTTTGFTMSYANFSAATNETAMSIAWFAVGQ